MLSALDALWRRIPRHVLVLMIDAAAVAASLPLALALREAPMLDPSRMAVSLTLLVAIALAVFSLTGSYRKLWRYVSVDDIGEIFKNALLIVSLFTVGQFFIDRMEALPRATPPLQIGLITAFMAGARVFYAKRVRAGAGSGSGPGVQRVLAVGGGDNAALLTHLLRIQGRGEVEVVGIVDDNVAARRSIGQVPYLGGVDRIEATLNKLAVHGTPPERLVVTRPHHEIGPERVAHVMEVAQRHGLPVEQLPDLIRLREAPRADRRASLPVHSRSNYLRLRRLADVALSAAVLAALAPLLAAVGLAVAVFLGTPVIFHQVRPGRGMRPFKLLKFRSMVDPARAGGRWLTDAERTPWLGRALRRSRIDELLQFWNVLKGDMTIIGPRPLVVADLLKFQDRGLERCRVRPGITGWAQVNGGHALSPEDKLALDLFYVRNAGLGLDLRIAWMTVLTMTRGERVGHAAIARAHAGQARAKPSALAPASSSKDDDQEAA